jgi:RNA polymerase sigma factor (sigma-70 family)
MHVAAHTHNDLVERDRLALENVRLVKSTIRRLGLSRHPHYDDLVAVGQVALLDAAARYDPTRGLRFSTLAVKFVRGRVLSYLRGRGRPMRLLSDYQVGRLVGRDEHGDRDQLELQAAVEGALASLPERWATALRCRFVDGATLEEVGAVLGVSISAAHRVVRQALDRLAEDCPALAELLA